MKKLFLLVWTGLIIFAVVIAQELYVPTFRDAQLLDSIQEVVDGYVENGNKERLVSSLSVIKEKKREVSDDSQASFVLYEVEQMLEKGLQIVILEETSGKKTKPEISLGTFLDGDTEESDEENVVKETPVVNLEPEPEEQLVAAPQDVLKQMSRQEFWDTYSPFILDRGALASRCFTYYDKIDAIAKKHDFPTGLIIATWHREHSCNFYNPDNRRGNFQITSHDYPPGDITREQFSHQIINFIEFSEAKRAWYDNIQVFGPEPVVLSYDSFNLSSIRKQAILYNGVYPDVTLDSSRYANENFTQARGGRDGVVAAFLKVLQWELER